MLIHKAVEDPLRGMPLLPMRVHVLSQHRVDQRLHRIQMRRLSAAGVVRSGGDADADADADARSCRPFADARHVDHQARIEIPPAS